MAKKKPPKKSAIGTDIVEGIFKFQERRDAFEKLEQVLEELFDGEHTIARRRMLITMTKVLCGMDTDALILLMAAMLEMNKPVGYGELACALGPPPNIKDGA